MDDVDELSVYRRVSSEWGYEEVASMVQRESSLSSVHVHTWSYTLHLALVLQELLRPNTSLRFLVENNPGVHVGRVKVVSFHRQTPPHNLIMRHNR